MNEQLNDDESGDFHATSRGSSDDGQSSAPPLDCLDHCVRVRTSEYLSFLCRNRLGFFFHFLRYDLNNPKSPLNDRFVLSKGHAAPILWEPWPRRELSLWKSLETLREIDSVLEGHPTPRSPYVDVATGSLGQGLSNAVGMALFIEN